MAKIPIENCVWEAGTLEPLWGHQQLMLKLQYICNRFLFLNIPYGPLLVKLIILFGKWGSCFQQLLPVIQFWYQRQHLELVTIFCTLFLAQIATRGTVKFWSLQLCLELCLPAIGLSIWSALIIWIGEHFVPINLFWGMQICGYPHDTGNWIREFHCKHEVRCNWRAEIKTTRESIFAENETFT